MYKSKLQELCQRLSWDLPDYRAQREGPDHNPRFTVTVTVNGVPFCNHNPCKSSKEAQNDVARLAFEHFTRPELTTPTAVATLNPNAGPFNATTHVISREHLPQQMVPSTTANGLAGAPKQDLGFSGFSSATSGQGSVFASRGISQSRAQSMHPIQQVDGNASYEKNGPMVAGIQHLYKNQLQIYAQKRNLVLPSYSHEREGPPHASIFRCKVTVDGKTYESQEFSPTLKEAEHAVAKVALMSLSQDGLQEDDLGLYKNLLQELAQKEGFSIPCYYTDRYGEVHIPSFISTVRIEGESFTGDQAKTKKQAEMNAAKVAYFTLKQRKPSKSFKIFSAVQQGPEACELSAHVPSSEITAEPQQVARAKSSRTSNPIVTSSGQVEQSRGKAEVSSQHCVLSPEPYTTRNAGSSSDDMISACWQDSIPFVPCAKDGPSSSSLLSECFERLTVGNSAESSAEMLTHGRKVIVFPRSANMAIPDDCTVLPISDDDWVAMERQSNQV